LKTDAYFWLYKLCKNYLNYTAERLYKTLKRRQTFWVYYCELK